MLTHTFKYMHVYNYYFYFKQLNKKMSYFIDNTY